MIMHSGLNVGRFWFPLFILVCLLAMSAEAAQATKNGFILTNATIDVDDILFGGPPKDGIPAINEPTFVAAGRADFLEDDDRVLGLSLAGEHRTYPISILNWHELVNDQVGKQSVLISFCPLCGTGVAYSAKVNGQDLAFGVSGLLYNSDVLFYDRQSQSLWSQILGQAVSGLMAGQSLEMLPISHTSWKAWRERFPDTLVLSPKTGFRRNYQQDPYAGYKESRRLYFKVAHQAPAQYHPKETVLGLTVAGIPKAYPFAELRRQGRAQFNDTVNGQSLTIYWDEQGQSARAVDKQGRELPAIQGFWFAWFAFHPRTLIYTAE